MINKILIPIAKTDITFEALEDKWTKKPYVFLFQSRCLQKNKKYWIHKDVEFNYIIKGRATAYVDNRIIPLTAGDIVCINPYVIHSIITDEDARLGTLLISTGFLSKNAVDIEKIKFCEFIHDEEATMLYNQLIKDHERGGSYCETIIRGDILRLIGYVCNNFSSEVSGEQELSNIHSFGRAFEYTIKAIDYIDANFKKNISLDDIGAAVGVTKHHILRTFKRVTGYTLTEHVNKIRCEYAKQLLEGGDHNVKQAAMLSGFENLSHFTNTFKKHIGCLPSEKLAQKSKK